MWKEVAGGLLLLRGWVKVMGVDGAPSIYPLHAPGESRDEEGEENCVREKGACLFMQEGDSIFILWTEA